jgi:hypothetical protein
VKGDLASEYQTDIRQWIDDIELSGGVNVLDSPRDVLAGQPTASLATLHSLDEELAG